MSNFSIHRMREVETENERKNLRGREIERKRE